MLRGIIGQYMAGQVGSVYRYSGAAKDKFSLVFRCPDEILQSVELFCYREGQVLAGFRWRCEAEGCFAKFVHRRERRRRKVTYQDQFLLSRVISILPEYFIQGCLYVNMARSRNVMQDSSLI